MNVTDEQFDHWMEHGFVVVPGFLTPEEVAKGQQEIEALLAGGVEGDGGDQFSFPALGPSMNRLAAHPGIVAFVERALGTREVMLMQSLFWPKRAGTASYDQKLHVNYVGNGLAYPRDDGDFRQVTMLVYYSDVTAELGPLHVVSQQHTRDRFLVPDTAERDDPLYTHEQPVIAPAGSLVIWGMRTWHRGSGFKATEGHRYAHFLVYRAAAHQWMGHGTDFAGQGYEEGLNRFLEEGSPRDRELIGFPGAGHPYWDEETLKGVGARYPGMDMEPYRAALGTPTGR